MKQSEKFEIVLSKNIVARELKRLYKLAGEKPSESIIFNLQEIEGITGVMNQPTAEEILTSKMDI